MRPPAFIWCFFQFLKIGLKWSYEWAGLQSCIHKCWPVNVPVCSILRLSSTIHIVDFTVFLFLCVYLFIFFIQLPVHHNKSSICCTLICRTLCQFSGFVCFFLFSFRILMLMLGGSVMKFHSSATSVSYCLHYLVCAMSHSRWASSVLLLNL